jgi:RNA polymerase sigma-B factor
MSALPDPRSGPGAGQSLSDALVERYLPLADRVARRYAYTAEPLEDLVQVARLGLIKAAQRWDPNRGTAFSSFAVPTMTGELRRYFRDRTWAIRPPRHLQELYLAVQCVREQLWQEHGHEPTAHQVATWLERPVEDILEAIEAGDGYEPKSLDAPVHRDELAGATGHDLVADTHDEFERCETAVTLQQLSAALSARDREVLRLRFCEDLLQREIAERVGCSQMHVSRILRDALRRLQAIAEGS